MVWENLPVGNSGLTLAIADLTSFQDGYIIDKESPICRVILIREVIFHHEE
jgi:hypothetical protein